MTRRSAYKREADPMPLSMEKHILLLGFTWSHEYFDWCQRHGFAQSLQKSKTALQEEREFKETLVAKRASHNRFHRKPRAFLEAVCRGDLSSAEIDRPLFKQIAAEVEQSNRSADYRKSLCDMLVSLVGKGDLVFESLPGANGAPLIRGLIKLHDRKDLWLRPIDEWKPKSKNSVRMFGELTHHLFDKYGDVPCFMEAVWLRADRPSWRFRDWYVHLGRGYNLRTAKTPISLTKKMAHHFLTAPSDYSVERALRWGQMKAFGASENSIHATVATRLGQSFVNEEFWETVLRFVANNPMLDPRQIGPIVDYIHHQRFEAVEVEIEPGLWRQDPPAQPGLSMQGRTVATLMRHVEEWHSSLGRYRGIPEGNYERSSVEGYVVERKEGRAKTRWVIRQLMSSRDLQVESEILKHCVASYHWSCARGSCTIWSLSKVHVDGNIERRQTIELDKNNTIVQCRGLANRDPSPEEWSMVNAWAGERGLQVSTYLH